MHFQPGGAVAHSHTHIDVYEGPSSHVCISMMLPPHTCVSVSQSPLTRVDLYDGPSSRVCVSLMVPPHMCVSV